MEKMDCNKPQKPFGSVEIQFNLGTGYILPNTHFGQGLVPSYSF